MKPYIDRAEDEYLVNARCNNCGHDFVHANKKGKVLPRMIFCPNCGCSSAERTIGKSPDDFFKNLLSLTGQPGQPE